MIDLCMNMPGKTDDNRSNGTINSGKDNINSPSVWNKVVKTIQSSNIDMDKLIKDSIDYGLDVGLFQQSKDGKIMSLEALQNNNLNNNNNETLTVKQKIVKSVNTPNMKQKTLYRSESGSFSCSSTTLSSTMKTRGCATKIDIRQSSGLKRRRNESHINNTSESESVNESKVKRPKVKCLRREMVRPIPICAYCLGDEVLNKRTHEQEDMITCWDCGTCAHPSCLRWPSSLLEKVRTIRWQCLQCKCCSYCGNVSKKDDDMLLCDVCDLGFHMYCFNPPMKALPKGEWICHLCRPLIHNKENVTSFSMDDFNFQPNCQIITIENVKKLCIPQKKVSDAIPIKRSKIGKLIIKSLPKIGKGSVKLSLLHQKKKKILDKAVQRQKSALTDGLTMFFTPGNKRQSRVSKQSLNADPLNSTREPKPATPYKERNSSFLSKQSSKSPISERKKQRKEYVKSVKENISVSESEADNNDSIESSSVGVTNELQSKESTSLIVLPKKRGRRPKVAPIEVESPKQNSFIESSVTESSSMTMSRIEQSTSQSIMSTENTESDPYPISDLDRQWYIEIQEKVAQLLPPPMDAPPQLQSLSKKSRQRPEHSEPPELSKEGGNGKDSVCELPTAAGDSVSQANKRFPPRIQIGKYVVDTWYSAPYPSEYARLNVLYICEYCLKHIKSYDIYVMHMEKCAQHFPPGNEIYRNGDLSVFEVDGYVSKLYCQQLCLLAKLFLDHKTLYYDVEPFLFYVAVIVKNQSCHIIGYFSKEKRSTHKYNLSCIMVLPPYQKFNYGRFLIDFSYLLSRVEEQSGSPEKPLSTLGRLSYESYWKSKVIPFLLNVDDVTGEFYQQLRLNKPPKGLSITIDRISTETGINPHDVANTIQLLSKTVDLDDSDRITIQLDWEKIKSESEKYAIRYPNWVPLDADCLRWAPLMPPNDRIQACVNQPSNASTNVSNVSVTLNSPDEKKEEIKPVTTIKSIKIRKSVTKTSSQSLEEFDSKSDQEPIVTATINQNKQRKLPKTIDKVKTPDFANSPPKLNFFPKSRQKVKSKIVAIQHRNIRRFTKDRLQMVPRNRKVSAKSLTREISIDIDIRPKICNREPKTENLNYSTETDAAEIKKQIFERNSIDFSSITPIVNIENQKRRGRKPKKRVDFERSSIKKSVLTHMITEIDPINVDLTFSDNSDNPDNDDCVEISDPIPRRQMDWRKSKPVLEMFQETMSTFGDMDTDNSKPSPPININEPSPVSTGHNTILCPTLVSPEIDLEEDSETDLILTGKRQPLIILEKLIILESEASVPQLNIIDLSEDIETVDNNLFAPFPDLGSREINITVSESTSKSDSPEMLSVEEILKLDEGIIEMSVSGLVSPSSFIKDFGAPTLSRVPSEESKEDSSNSLQLPSDISLNEEFRRFYNDGNVFNSIATSQTDSSDKDANESLLSVSNSDLDVIGTYSCDSSLQCFNKSVRCSPGQSDIVQSQVSSTTVNFITPNADWNSPIKHLETLCVLVDPLSPIVTLSDMNNSRKRDPIKNKEEVEFVRNSELEAPKSVAKNVVSSSLDHLSEDIVENESVVSSMEPALLLETLHDVNDANDAKTT